MPKKAVQSTVSEQKKRNAKQLTRTTNKMQQEKHKGQTYMLR